MREKRNGLALDVAWMRRRPWGFPEMRVEERHYARDRRLRPQRGRTRQHASHIFTPEPSNTQKVIVLPMRYNTTIGMRKSDASIQAPKSSWSFRDMTALHSEKQHANVLLSVVKVTTSAFTGTSSRSGTRSGTSGARSTRAVRRADMSCRHRLRERICQRH
jgi:hypothetical protein